MNKLNEKIFEKGLTNGLICGIIITVRGTDSPTTGGVSNSVSIGRQPLDVGQYICRVRPLIARQPSRLINQVERTYSGFVDVRGHSPKPH